MCCGQSVAQKYGPDGNNPTGWVVTYPDGKKIAKETEMAARVAAALVPGASYAKAE